MKPVVHVENVSYAYNGGSQEQVEALPVRIHNPAHEDHVIIQVDLPDHLAGPGVDHQHGLALQTRRVQNVSGLVEDQFSRGLQI
ncbi:MAG TPA: hypothetical protein DCQ13_01545, partial [Firmicutes bacterium]|nr:hypothetical protein [Bacillota bacterium]